MSFSDLDITSNKWRTKEFNDKKVLVREFPSGIWYAVATSSDGREIISRGVTWQIAAEQAVNLSLVDEILVQKLKG